MSSQTSELAYIPLSLKPRIVAGGKGLLAFAMSVYQLWYVVLLDISIQATSSKPISFFNIDPFNNSLNLLLHAGFIGIVIGYALIALRSAITGYAPTRGTVTYRSFGARYPDTPGTDHVNVTEDSPVAPVALVAFRGLEEDYIDGSFEEYSSTESLSTPSSALSQEDTHQLPYMDELIRQSFSSPDDQESQQCITSALMVCPVHNQKEAAYGGQAPHDLAPIDKFLCILVSFFKELTVTVVLTVGTVIKQCQIDLDNRLKAVVGFLAIHFNGIKKEWKDFDGLVFHHVERSSLDNAKYDLKERVHQAIKMLDPTHPAVDVFVPRKSKKSSSQKRTICDTALSAYWRSFSSVELEVLAYHSIFRDIQAGVRYYGDIPLTKIRALYQKVIEAYGEKGFLGKHLENDVDNRWSWALPYHLFIRDGQLICISFCAEYERRAGQQSNDPQVLQECLEQEAWLWREAAYTAMSIQPDLERGEYALRRYLGTCDLLGWREAAKAVVHQYCLRMDELVPDAKLHADTLALIEKVTKRR